MAQKYIGNCYGYDGETAIYGGSPSLTPAQRKAQQEAEKRARAIKPSRVAKKAPAKKTTARKSVKKK